jgi:hypothetical protein
VILPFNNHDLSIIWDKESETMRLFDIHTEPGPEIRLRAVCAVIGCSDQRIFYVQQEASSSGKRTRYKSSLKVYQRPLDSSTIGDAEFVTDLPYMDTSSKFDMSCTSQGSEEVLLVASTSGQAEIVRIPF